MRSMVPSGTRASSGLLVVAVLAAVGLVADPMAPPAAASGELNWIDWTAPGSYPQTGTEPDTYKYATSADGELELADGTTVYVTLTGEVVDPTLDGTGTNVGTSCTAFCGPSGFSTSTPPTTKDNFWQTYPFSGPDSYTFGSGTGNPGNGESFTSANVPLAQLPENGDHIGLVGASVDDGGNPTQTLTFYSDAGRTTPVEVSDIIMIIGSLGGDHTPPTPSTAVWDFTQDVVVLSDNRAVAGATGLTRTVKDPGGTGADYQISGLEGSGAIQFVGSFSELSWTVSAPEIWASWNIAATSVPVSSPDAEDESGPEEAVATVQLALDCRPDPVVAGSEITCDVSGGDAGIDILWRASVGDPFAERGVTLDDGGRGTFRLVAPSDAAGSSVLVELVDWGVDDRVAVVAAPVPSAVPAGDAPSPSVPRGLLALVLVASIVLLVRSGVPEPA